ncbi:MAG TPA: hypothetical protein VI138_05195, partial [Candidatus Dormibacteraeota bacterium]
MSNPLNKRPTRPSGWINRGGLGPVLAGLGVVLIAAGLAVFVPPLVGVLQRSSADTKALQEWKAPGSALSSRLPKVKTVQQPGSSPGATEPACGSGAAASS